MSIKTRKISSEEFELHKVAILERYQQLGIQQVELREEKRGDILMANIVGFKMSFEGAMETKSTLFPLEVEVLEELVQ